MAGVPSLADSTAREMILSMQALRQIYMRLGAPFTLL